jgi:hypothetical protein
MEPKEYKVESTTHTYVVNVPNERELQVHNVNSVDLSIPGQVTFLSWSGKVIAFFRCPVITFYAVGV